MKKIKVVLLLYSLILTISFITIGFINIEYNDLTPIILLIPVWLYFFLLLMRMAGETLLFDPHKGINNLIRILGIYSTLVVFLIVLASLASSSSLAESSFTLIFLPLLISCLLNLFDPKALQQFKLTKLIALIKLLRARKKSTGAELRKVKVEEVQEIKDQKKANKVAKKLSAVPTIIDENNDSPEITDQKRRQFLKIVGGGGVSLFLMLFVFKGNAQAAFFGSGGGPGVVALKDKNGNKIDPAEKNPTDGYTISEIDDSGVPSYYGFIHKSGSWYIAREEANGSYRYANGGSNFTSGWSGRVGLTYDYFDNVF